MAAFELIAACAFGLESIVRRELNDLGIHATVGSAGQVHFLGDETTVVRANLWLRTADRIRIRLAHFPAPDFDTLFETVRTLPLDRWIPADGAFPVTGRSVKSTLSSVPAIQRTVKKAIVTALQRQHQTQQLDELAETYPIEISLLNDQATLTLDTTGPSLHKRGYRARNGPAPLKETLAAALVQLSFWKPGRPLIDPFCGTGTILIEAAGIGQNLAPGLRRSFQAEAWPRFPREVWHDLRAEARSRATGALPIRLMGTDQDSAVLKLARENAERAGVADQIHFQEKSFDQLTSKRQYGCLITNPPYGQRIGTNVDLCKLYESIPEVLSRLPTWSHFILTAYPDFERVVQRPAERRRKLYNGRIQCTYFQYHGPKPPEQRELSRPVAEPHLWSANLPDSRSVEGNVDRNIQPVFGGLDPKVDEQAELFAARLRKRARHLRRWPSKQGITCFRIYERDIPEIPLVVDRYEDHLHLVEYDRPHQRDRAQHAQWLDRMAHTAARSLGVPSSQVFVKRRHRQRGSRQHMKLAQKRHEIVVQEGGLRFYVNLSDYTDTGLFLDHRLTRSLARRWARGKRFLNLFGYTGAFTVYAADGAAAKTTTVDLSPVYLDWTERNLRLNQLAGPQHKLIRADALTYLRQLPQQPLFDFAVVDPPTFSNSKRTERTWDVQRDHVECLNELLTRVAPGGTILFSTNFRRFKLDEAAIDAVSIHEISRQTIPPDYRNRRIHRCWRLDC